MSAKAPPVVGGPSLRNRVKVLCSIASPSSLKVTTPTAPDRGRHGAGVEWLPAHGGVSMWGGVRTVGDA
jgi:hypothetical protein